MKGNDNIYEVESIIGKRYLNNEPLYYVKWKGFTTTDCTWEPLANLKNVQHLIKRFETKMENNECIKMSENEIHKRIKDKDTKEAKNTKNTKIITSPIKNVKKKPEERPILPQQFIGTKRSKNVNNKTITSNDSIVLIDNSNIKKKKNNNINDNKKKETKTRNLQEIDLIENELINEHKNNNEVGRFEYDVPRKILSIYIRDNNIYLLVKWNRRYDGVEPKQSYVRSDLLRINYTNMLCDFYEESIIDKDKI